MRDLCNIYIKKNDFASLGLNLFFTCYDDEGIREKNCVYYFGLDPIWHIVF